VNSEARIRTLLADLADGDPPVGIDLDRQITRGRRRLRYRRMSATGLAFTAVLAVASGAATLLPRDNSAPLQAATATARCNTHGDLTGRLRPSVSGWPGLGLGFRGISTPRSQALLCQVSARVPGVPARNAVVGDSERFDVHCNPLYDVFAGVVRDYPSGGRTYRLVVGVEVERSTHRLDTGRAACVDPGQAGPGDTCLDVRELPDGSTGYLINQRYGRKLVQVVHPDGSQIEVTWVGAQQGPNRLSAERVLEIARGITMPW
jgi:hypothetical protein